MPARRWFPCAVVAVVMMPVARAEQPAFSRAPYLQLATDSSIRIVWRTEREITPVVRYGKDQAAWAAQKADFASEKAERYARYDESDRLVAQHWQKVENERAQEAAWNSTSGPGCSQPACTQEPRNQFAGGQELCGLHTLGVLNSNY